MKAELKVMFYSPIAWLVLVVFAFQVGGTFYDLYDGVVKWQGLGYATYNATSELMSGIRGITVQMLDVLYLYIPLLTMGLISRELGSGSIKLLYSSPVSNFQIIIGKYLSVIVYGLLLVVILILPTFYIIPTIKDPDVIMMYVAVFGVFLTICAYAAIGLFMSCITRYQVVAVIATLIVLAFLNFVGGMGQEIDFVRDITYWLSISGRSRSFLAGMISTKDLMYFILVITLFLSLALIKIRGERLRIHKFKSFLIYFSVVSVVLLFGYISSLPKLSAYYDTTNAKVNTLTKYSQEVVDKIDDGLTITTYVNYLDDTWFTGSPRSRNYDIRKFERYLRFKPETKIKYVYYYGKGNHSSYNESYPDCTPKEIFDTVTRFRPSMRKNFISEEQACDMYDISKEGGRLVRVLEREDGRTAILRMYNDNRKDPGEEEITTALKTLTQKSPLVAFVSGHDERKYDDRSELGYYSFAEDRAGRYSLINRGFSLEERTLDKPVPINVDILVISDSKSSFSEEELKNYNKYLDRGGNVFILGEPRRQEFMNPLLEPFGVKFSDGVVVTNSEIYSNDEIFADFSANTELGSILSNSQKSGYTFTTKTVAAIEQFDQNTKYKMSVLANSPKAGSWVEKDKINFMLDKPSLDKDEVEQPNAIAYYGEREISGEKQRIVIVGDSDCLSTKEMLASRAGLANGNFSTLNNIFYVFTNGEFPVNIDREMSPDTKYYASRSDLKIMQIIYVGLIPLIILGMCLVILIKRRNN